MEKRPFEYVFPTENRVFHCNVGLPEGNICAVALVLWLKKPFCCWNPYGTRPFTKNLKGAAPWLSANIATADDVLSQITVERLPDSKRMPEKCLQVMSRFVPCLHGGNLWITRCAWRLDISWREPEVFLSVTSIFFAVRGNLLEARIWRILRSIGHRNPKDIPRFCEVIKNAMRCSDKDAAVIAIIGEK